MEYENPAERLYLMLEEGKKIGATVPSRTAWIKLLNIEDSSNHALLMSRLGKFMELPSQVYKLMNEYYPENKKAMDYWILKINNGFGKHSLNTQWSEFITSIDEHSMNYIKMASGFLKNKSLTKYISDENLEDFRKKIQELYDEIFQSDIEQSVKEFLLRSLQNILINIDEYFITGSSEIMNSISSTMGCLFFDKKYKDEIMNTKNEKIRSKMFDIFSGFARTIEVTAAGAVLTNEAIKLLGSIGS